MPGMPTLAGDIAGVNGWNIKGLCQGGKPGTGTCLCGAW